MNLLADEGIDKPIVDALRNAGFDVVYILETNPAADDSFILSLANTEKRFLLTQDKDFGELVFRLKQAHYGVILIRLHGYTPTLKSRNNNICFIETHKRIDRSIYCYST